MKKFGFLLILLSCVVFGFAQSADFIEAFVKQSEINYLQMVYLVSLDTGLVQESENNSLVDIENLSESKIVTESLIKFQEAYPKVAKRLQSQKILNAQNFAYLCSSVYGLKTSIFYRIFKSPRYAFRQFKGQRYYEMSIDPNEKINGRKALLILASLSDNK